MASGARYSHISSQLFPLGRVKVLLRISIVKTYECGVRNMASKCRHAWREEVIREISVTLLLGPTVCELYSVADVFLLPSSRYIQGVSKSSVNGIRKQQKTRFKQNKFIGLQNNRHPSQHTFGNVRKPSGNCQQRPL